jgi:cytochrome b6-f complex iron-sulfur subunit
MSEHGPPINSGRRNFFRAILGAFSITSFAAIVYPVIGFFKRPANLNAAKPVEIPLANLTPGQAQYVDDQGQQVIVLQSSEGPKVFSASCPHLGCNVMWNEADAVFRCPCHGAVFDPAGAVIRGPVSGSLAKIPFEIKDQKIIIG